jgi:hypothetical protein
MFHTYSPLISVKNNECRDAKYVCPQHNSWQLFLAYLFKYVSTLHIINIIIIVTMND